MKNLLLSLLILMGCGQHKNEDQQVNAGNTSIKQISVTQVSGTNPNYVGYTMDIMLLKQSTGNQTTLYYIDSLNKGLSLGNFTIYSDNHESILWDKDRCL
jgi:hypothetical protein